MREFESGLMRLLRLLHCQHRRAGGSSSSSPVVGSISTSHCLFVLSLSQVTTIWVEVEKAFQFFSNDSVNRRIMKKVGMVTCHRRSWSHVTEGHGHMSPAKKDHTPLCDLSRVK